jgi:hypothetical protein
MGSFYITTPKGKRQYIDIPYKRGFASVIPDISGKYAYNNDSKVKLHATEGAMSKYGYTTKESPLNRYKSIDKSIINDPRGASAIFRHLNVRAIQNKHNTKVCNIMRRDMNYIKLMTELYDECGYYWENEHRSKSLKCLYREYGNEESTYLLNKLLEYWEGDRKAEYIINNDLKYF